MQKMIEHLAVDTSGEPYVPVGWFDFAAHDRWVRAGHCPVVSRDKAWCAQPSGHGTGTHGSPWCPPEERGVHWAEWAE